VTIRKFKLDYDWKQFAKELDELFPLAAYDWHQEFPTPKGNFYQNVPEHEFPTHLRLAIERSIGYPIKNKGWMWDWRCITTDLKRHVDTVKAAHHTGISEWDKDIFEDNPSVYGRPPITVNIALENDFRLDVQDQITKEWVSVIYGPGDIVMFNNNTQMHGGDVLNDPLNISRRSLNCYLDTDELFDPYHTFWQQSNKNVPWPVIKTKIENGQKVPLKEDYAFDDMAYLDTVEAYELFETQADIIIAKKCTGIVDMGCRHGPVLDILHQKGYTDFTYMGIDTSREPIILAQEKWKDYPNIEFRSGSWNDATLLEVGFAVDQVIWSGVLLYRPDDHFEFFDKITREMYNSPNAIIQEPTNTQRHWEPNLILNRISDDFEKYKTTYADFNEIMLDLELFAGRRVVVDVTL
jgi:hypothetical protein